MKELKLQLIVLLQQVLLFLFLIQWPWSLPWWAYAVIVLLCAPALFAVYAQRRQFRISPKPKEGARLLTHGPYRYIRHPMYFSLMTALFVPLFWKFDVWLLLTYVVLLVVLLFKVHEEEKLLRETFPKYKDYQRKTKKLLPFLF